MIRPIGEARHHAWASAGDHVAIGASGRDTNERATAHSFAFVMLAGAFRGLPFLPRPFVQPLFVSQPTTGFHPFLSPRPHSSEATGHADLPFKRSRCRVEYAIAGVNQSRAICLLLEM